MIYVYSATVVIFASHKRAKNDRQIEIFGYKWVARLSTLGVLHFYCFVSIVSKSSSCLKNATSILTFPYTYMTYTSPDVYEYISREMKDPIVEWKTCRVSWQKFAITQADIDFYAKISPTFDGKTFAIPTPTLCPEERQRRRLAFRNERKLYRRKCDATHKNIISMYHPESQYKIYDQKLRWSDQWSALDYWVVPSWSFVQDYKKLQRAVPRVSIFNDNQTESVNCEYTNDMNYGKNCYLVFSSRNIEDSSYCSGSCNYNSSIFDCTFVSHSERVYESIHSNDVKNSTYIQFSSSVNRCHYGIDLTWCNDCFFCIWLVNKSFCIFNKQYSEEEYNKKIHLLKLPKNWSAYVEKFVARSTWKIYPAYRSIRTEQCFWNNIFDSHNGLFCYDGVKIEDSKYFYGWAWPKNCMDVENSWEPTRCYEWSVPDESYNVHFSFFSRKCKDSLYLDNCHSVSNCFWCVWLRNASYCIFNKQYTKHEYEQTVAKIIAQMQEEGTRGEFFDPSLSPFGYNETVAMEYFPLERDGDMLVTSSPPTPLSERGAREASLLPPQRGGPRGSVWVIDYSRFWYKRSDYEHETKIPEGAPVVRREEYTNAERQALRDDDQIVNKILVCEVSGKPYRIIKQELDFYRKHDLPIPSKHPDVRHAERGAKRPGRTLYLRTCDATGEEMISVYPPDSQYTVYSEAAYRKEVMG